MSVTSARFAPASHQTVRIRNLINRYMPESPSRTPRWTGDSDGAERAGSDPRFFSIAMGGMACVTKKKIPAMMSFKLNISEDWNRNMHQGEKTARGTSFLLQSSRS
jgi:hypothetical protein